MIKIANDKLLHLSVGLIVYSGISIFSLDYALLVVLILGIGKEIYDYYDYGGFDRADMVWTVSAPLALYITETIKGY